MRHRTLTAAALATLAVLSLASGCAGSTTPVVERRELLGTIVTITAYHAQEASTDESVRKAVDVAFAAIAEVESELDAHDPNSAVGKINAAPDPLAKPLPVRAEAILDATCALEVREWFSPHLWAEMRLWAFDEGGRLPLDAELDRALVDTRYDFGAAAKGLALDEAAEALGASDAVEAAILTSGSTTLTIGRKPDGEPWRIGIEDPRDPDSHVATIEAPGEITVSTSGDYQRFFERGSARFHHILDPRTGSPAPGIRSLTVIGQIPGLDSDILSTALFVAGPDAALRYAEERGLGLVLVDSHGTTHIAPGPDSRTFEITRQDSDTP